MSFTPNYFSQQDPRWVDEKLGFDDTLTIGTAGCCPTCLAILVNGYGFEETPSSINSKLKGLGNGVGYLGGLIIWAGLEGVFPTVDFNRIVLCREQAAPLDAINASLDEGQPLVVEIDRSASSGLQTHWVVIYGRQDDDYLMLDPWPLPSDNVPVTLSSRYADGRPLSEFITAVVWYKIPDNTATDTSSPSTSEEVLYVRVQSSVTAGLRMRSGPSISADILTVEPAGTRLKCLESKEDVLAKVGVMNQWLHVSDPDGLEGYVAAWYVEKEEEIEVNDASAAESQAEGTSETQAETASETQPDTTSSSQTASTPLTLVVSQIVGAVGLRLRSQPSMDSTTLAILIAGTELTVLESTDEALPKVGQKNQWLNVSDGSHTGYVAAWYVELKAT